MKRGLILFSVLILGAACTDAQSRATLSLGHAGAVHDIAGRSDLDLGFSVGADGRLIVWNLEHGGLHTSWQIGHQPVTRIAIHPTRPEAVVYVQDGIATGRIIGMNWETGETLFVVPMNQRLNTIEYSPQGTFVVYTLPSFDSVRVIDARDGSRQPYLSDGFGVVGFIQMARSERNIMTYVPSRGEFIYWQMQTGDELQTVSTESRLTHVTLVDRQTQRYLAASDGSRLVIVDNLTGDIQASYPVAPVRAIRYDAESDRILVLSEEAGSPSVLAFTYSANRLRRDFYRLQNLSSRNTIVAPVGTSAHRGYLAGASDGEIAYHDRRIGRRNVFGPAPVDRILDVAFTPGRMHLSLGNRLLTLESDLFDADRTTIGASFMRNQHIELAGLQAARIVSDEDRLLVWGTNDPGSVHEVIYPSNELVPVYHDPQRVPIVRLRTNETGLLVVHRDGRVIQTDRETGAPLFSYTAVGSQDAIWDPQSGLIVAKSRATGLDSSIVHVDRRTMETVTAGTDAFLSTRLAYDDVTETVFAIGLHGRQTAPTTRLLQFRGRGFRERLDVYEASTELAQGDLLWDSRSRALLSTIEYNRVLRYNYLGQELLGRTERLHGELAVGANLVVARNLDGTLTIWNRETGAHLAEFAVIGDEWVLISQEGAFLVSSPAAESYVTFLPADRTRLTLRDFRIQLPFEESATRRSMPVR